MAAEAQMMNTIEYRVDCQLLRFLHNDNNLGTRFPIGKVEQARAVSPSQQAGSRVDRTFGLHAFIFIIYLHKHVCNNIDTLQNYISTVCSTAHLVLQLLPQHSPVTCRCPSGAERSWLSSGTGGTTLPMPRCTSWATSTARWQKWRISSGRPSRPSRLACMRLPRALTLRSATACPCRPPCPPTAMQAPAQMVMAHLLSWHPEIGKR